MRRVRRLGAIPAGDGRVGFCVWAPNARSVAVCLHGREHALEPAEHGLFAAELTATPGDDYLYVLDGGEPLPDPCSRFQPEGVRGPSRIVETIPKKIAPGPRLATEDLVVYELHVGAFSEEGTFDGVVPHLRELRELGVTAIEVMPIATFPGNRGWGYDGVYLYAAHPAYGGPEDFARLVDAAHREGLAVILDVVYNHLGPGSDRIAAFGPYLTDRHETPWGGALDYSQGGVREWALQNAEQWVTEFRVDGLRLDAVFMIFDDGPQHVLAELRERLPDTLLIAEEEVGNLQPLEEWRFDAQWADEFHHELHVLLTGERHGYYQHYGSVQGLADEYERDPRLVYCSQNHDQVGNRAQGDRPQPDELALRAHALLFAPQIPLLFMGEEYGEQAPFQFFTDHIDPFIADATRAGRRREFAIQGDVPDPQAEATFLASKLTRRRDPELEGLYRRLLALRRERPPETEAAIEGSTLCVRRGSHELILDFERRSAELR